MHNNNNTWSIDSSSDRNSLSRSSDIWLSDAEEDDNYTRFVRNTRPLHLDFFEIESKLQNIDLYDDDEEERKENENENDVYLVRHYTYEIQYEMLQLYDMGDGWMFIQSLTPSQRNDFFFSAIETGRIDIVEDSPPDTDFSDVFIRAAQLDRVDVLNIIADRTSHETHVAAAVNAFAYGGEAALRWILSSRLVSVSEVYEGIIKSGIPIHLSLMGFRAKYLKRGI